MLAQHFNKRIGVVTKANERPSLSISLLTYASTTVLSLSLLLSPCLVLAHPAHHLNSVAVIGILVLGVEGGVEGVVDGEVVGGDNDGRRP